MFSKMGSVISKKGSVGRANLINSPCSIALFPKLSVSSSISCLRKTPSRVR